MASCPLCGCPGGCAPVDATSWIEIGEYAAMLGIDRSTVWRWRRAGYLAAQRLDGKIRVRELDDRTRFPTDAGFP